MNNCTKTSINQWLSFKQMDAEWDSAESILDTIFFSTFIQIMALEQSTHIHKCAYMYNLQIAWS